MPIQSPPSTRVARTELDRLTTGDAPSPAPRREQRIFWLSDPVGPDETLLVCGEDLDHVHLEMAQLAADAAGDPPSGGEDQGAPTLEAWVAPEVLQRSGQSLKAVVPKDWPAGVFACRLRTGSDPGPPVLVNRPNVWWMQGDAGSRCRSGGWLRLFGKCLCFGDPRVALRSLTEDRLIQLTPQQADGYAVWLQLPKIDPGAYDVWVHNGTGGQAGWRRAGEVEALPPMAEPEIVVNVLDFGARPNRDEDCTLAIVGALERLAGLGGGVLYFPRGRYRIDSGLRSGMFLPHPLKVPAGVTLRGEAMELVSLYWPDRQEPLPTLIEGGDRFGVENMTLYCQGRHRNVISGESHVRISKVRIRASAYYMLDEQGKARHGRNNEESNRKTGAAIELCGSDVQITDCDIYHSHEGICLKHVRGGVVARNHIQYGSNYALMYGGDGVIFEDNVCTGGNLTASGGGLSLYYGATTCRHYYFARNTIRHAYGGDREALTLDGHGTAYLGGVVATDGTRVTLAQPPQFGNHKELRPSWHGLHVFILHGRGAGQYRALTGCRDRVVDIDRPWDVAPDASSILSIGVFNGRHLFIGNQVFDAGSIIQLYPPNIECIVAENHGARAGNFNAGGMLTFRMPWGGQRVEPCWRHQYLDNCIDEGNGWGGGAGGSSAVNGMLGGEAMVNIYGTHTEPQINTPIVRHQVVRRHVGGNNSAIRISGAVVDVIVEHCVLRHNERGIMAEPTGRRDTESLDNGNVVGAPRQVLLRHNRFEDVATPYIVESEDVVVEPPGGAAPPEPGAIPAIHAGVAAAQS